MKFDKYGKRVKEETHHEKLCSDDIIVDLDSKYPGIPDSAISVVFGMTHKDRKDQMGVILSEIQQYDSKINDLSGNVSRDDNV